MIQFKELKHLNNRTIREQGSSTPVAKGCSVKSHLSEKDCSTHAKMRDTLLIRSLNVDMIGHCEKYGGGREGSLGCGLLFLY